MDRKSTPTKISHLPSRNTAGPSSPYLSFTQELSKAPNRELSLVIDCERFTELVNTPMGMVDDLGREIRLWASVLGARSIRSFYLLHPYKYLEPFELTRVLHEVASNFHVKDREARRYTVVSTADDISAEHLALIKGLGFNCYQILITSEQLSNPQYLKKKISLIRDFAISTGLQLFHTDCLSEITTAIKRVEAEFSPDYVCIGNTSDGFDVISSSKTYHSDFPERQKLDILELGPESVSNINGIKIQGYCAPEKYRASLEVNRLPIHVSIASESKSSF